MKKLIIIAAAAIIIFACKPDGESTAKKTGATVEQVRARFYELAVSKTARGNYYQDARGAWQKK